MTETARDEPMDRVPVRRRLIGGWQSVAGRFGSVQTLVILALFYVVLIGPVTLVTAVFRRDLLGKRGLWRDGTAWGNADSAAPDLERAKLTS